VGAIEITPSIGFQVGDRFVFNPTVVATSVENGNEPPLTFSLSQNFPNPFNPTTNFEFRLPVRNMVVVKVFDLLGREIATLVNDTRDAGTYRVSWNGQSVNGVATSTGVYFCRIEAGDFVQTKKMVLIR
jgi:hypothetical protein